MKQYSLTKSELESVTQVLPLISHYEQVLEALRLQFRTAIVTGAFKRLDIAPELIQFCQVDLSGGNIEIHEPEPEKPEETQTPEKVE